MADQEDGTQPQDGHSPSESGRDISSDRVLFDAASVASTSTAGDASKTVSAMTSPLGMDFKQPEEDEQGIPKFPSLQHNPDSKGDEGEDEESTAEPFQWTKNPEPDLKRNKGAVYEKVGDQGVCKMHKFSLYETATRYYIVGADVVDKHFRILKIDRTADAGSLSIAEDEIVYTKKEMTQLLNAIDDGNKSTGGMKLRCSTCGLLGFIRFTGAYYMLLITKRKQVAMIGGHFIYSVDGTELVPLTWHSSRFKPDLKNTEETRFLGILNNLDLTRSFYFSYSYDITRTLQSNIITERQAVADGAPYPHPPDCNSMFVWNSYLLQPAGAALKNTYDWCLPIIHGYMDQSGLLGRPKT
jgi:hypothetical protein